MKMLSAVILALSLLGASAPAQSDVMGETKKQAEHKDKAKAKGELKDSKAKNKAAEKKTQTEKK